MPSLFDKLPFVEAIDALRERLALPKTPAEAAAFGARGGRVTDFLSLDAANRSRAFTMAWISDQALLENIHDELSIAINNGETYLDFRHRLEDLQQRSGWTGTSPWHYRVVYDQNLGMAYSAGRVQQGQESGLRVWRYLASVSADPRPEHEPFYGNLYQMAPGTPVPPIDFGCNCGWEWVFEDELGGADPASFPVFSPPVPRSGFQWSASDYLDLGRTLAFNRAVSAAPGLIDGTGLRRIANAAIEATSNQVQRWFDAAMKAAGRIGEGKFAALIAWADSVGNLAALQAWVRDGMTELALTAEAGGRPRTPAALAVRDDDLAELNHLVTLAALLRGRVDVSEGNK